eukprot:m.9586 g.9586  ORF g.9586 m.9586 type:complete len:389 (-) comp6963_c0_seq1:329-1495(-)
MERSANKPKLVRLSSAVYLASLCTSAASTPIIASSSNCAGSDRVLHGDRCFVLHQTAAAWDDARDVCADSYTGYTMAHLATVQDTADRNALTTLALANSVTSSFWIGLHLPDADTTLNLNFAGLEWDSDETVDVTFLNSIGWSTLGQGRCFGVGATTGTLTRSSASSISSCGLLPFFCEYGATFAPTDAPTDAPSLSPTLIPTDSPTLVPTDVPTDIPTDAPSLSPTSLPTVSPTVPPPPCPSTCDTCVWHDASTVECLTCPSTRFLEQGHCLFSMKCRDDEILWGPLQGETCSCADDHAYTCVKNATDEVAKKCKDSFYLHEEACVNLCPWPLVPYGTGSVGLACVVPFTCTGGIGGPDGPTDTSCSCAGSCTSCTFDDYGETCIDP